MLKKPFLLLIGFFGLVALWTLFVPVGGSEETVVSIGVGQGASSISKTLKEAGVIRSSLAFRLVTRVTGQQGQLKAGDYAVPGGLNVLQTLDLLVSGKTLVHRFLVREGLSGKQIAALVEKAGLGTAVAFRQAMADPVFLKELGIPGPTVEGYLFPDTYQLAKGLDEKALVKLMIERFKAKVPATLLAQGAAIRLSPLQVMTMASMIEKEAKADKELCS